MSLTAQPQPAEPAQPTPFETVFQWIMDTIVHPLFGNGTWNGRIHKTAASLANPDSDTLGAAAAPPEVDIPRFLKPEFLLQGFQPPKAPEAAAPERPNTAPAPETRVDGLGLIKTKGRIDKSWRQPRKKRLKVQ